MYLKKIEIHGFKSFADKIIVQFEGGITAVVGPNGSGKSNVSDAVRWVLGEQSAKTLRGGSMQDVIFSGTEHRKPLNFAEVSLIMDNADGSLPVEYSEVSITRRIYRSGESEYYINKTGCRLKDIHELFMDTGVGRDGYSIIGQGRIDEILSSKSEDRRNIFEEASGIMKYKTRKIEAERKLESTKQNLLRINDIISELEIQIDPLREQSEKAKRYLELSEQHKVLDINLFIENYGKLKEKLEAAKLQFTEIEKSHADYTQKLEDSDASYNGMVGQNKELENDILAINQQVFEIEKLIEKIHSDINVAKEKIHNHEQNKERILNEALGYKEKISALDEDLNKRNEKLAELSAQIEMVSNCVLEKENELAKTNGLLEQSLNDIEGLKSDIIEKHNEISSKKGSVNSITVLLDNVKNRKEQIQSEINELETEKHVKLEQYNSLEKRLNETKEIIDSVSKSITKFNDEKTKTENEIRNSLIEIDKTKGLLSSKTSRHQLLSDMDKEYEGFNKSVKSILQACEKSSSLGRGVHGALVQLISVPKKYETAVEIALGGALQNIVTDDEESATKIIDYLKQNRLGRATFLPMSAVKPRYFDGLEKELKGVVGFVGVASDLIQFDKKYAGIIGNLLGKVLVVDTIQNGIAAAKKYRYSFKIVTLDGEVLNPGGSMAGGSTNKSTSLLSRSREIEELSNEIGKLNSELEEYNNKNKELNLRLQEININIEKESFAQRNNELTLVTVEGEIKQCKENLDRVEERVRILAIEESQLSEQKIQALQEIDALKLQIEELSKEIDEISKQTSLNQEKYKKDIEERDALLESMTSEKVKLSGINQETISVNENIERLNSEIEQVKMLISQSDAFISSIEMELSEQTGIIDSKNKELEEQDKLKEEISQKLKQTTEQKTGVELELDNLQKKWKEYNAALNSAAEERNKVEIKVTKYEMEIEALQNRMWEEYEMTYSKCLEYQTDISHFGNPNKAINDIKKEINSLGHINIDAIEEYVKVKERYEFLSEQKNDLEEAEKSLRKVIHDMVQIMKKQFIEQFEIINANFNEVFKELFGGGRAHLKLMDPENVLECGIEIEAQPPGKKLQNLTLLSGGERALTAIAILFAMLKVRPTPFCILDEIEAALDDVNVFRFADYIKKFSEKTQFLVITHRKGTMEAADELYGVTMQEHGVSKLVSVKLSEQAS